LRRCVVRFWDCRSLERFYFALSVTRPSRVSDLPRTLGIPPQNVYIVFTEHDGPDFQMHDGVLPSWSAGEDPLQGMR